MRIFEIVLSCLARKSSNMVVVLALGAIKSTSAPFGITATASSTMRAKLAAISLFSAFVAPWEALPITQGEPYFSINLA